MMAKLDIYRKFTNALAVAVLVSVGWVCYEVTLVVIVSTPSFYVLCCIGYVSMSNNLRIL